MSPEGRSPGAAGVPGGVVPFFCIDRCEAEEKTDDAEEKEPEDATLLRVLGFFPVLLLLFPPQDIFAARFENIFFFLGFF